MDWVVKFTVLVPLNYCILPEVRKNFRLYGCCLLFYGWSATFCNKSQFFLHSLNFVRSLWKDFEVGFKYRIRADLKRLPAVRYALSILNVKPLSL